MANNKVNKVQYYEDLLNDDFVGIQIKNKQPLKNIKYVHKHFLFKSGSKLLTFLIAVPILRLLLLFKNGLVIKNKKVLRKVRGKAYFLYGNHTLDGDAYIPQAAINPFRKTYVIANPDAISIKGLRVIVQMLGAIPLPDINSDKAGTKAFLEAIDTHVKGKKCIAVYPEAHVWPYVTFIRPFKSNNFHYPVKHNVPVIAMTTTFRKRLLFKTPRVVITLSKVFYPNNTLSVASAKEELRNSVYDFMVKEANNPKNYTYIKYLHISEKDKLTN